MTEDEARTKRCCWPQVGKCIASECMLWRFTDYSGKERIHLKVVDQWAANGWSVSDPEPDERGYVEVSRAPTNGVCGLVRSPE